MLVLARSDVAEWPLCRESFYLDELVEGSGGAPRASSRARVASTIAVSTPADLQIRRR